MTTAPHEPLGQRPALTGVRAVAVALVMGVHFARARVPGGWVGVDIFFVLSGFLITTLLLEEFGRRDRIALGRFYMRRVLRLFPALYLLLAGLTIYSLVVLRGDELSGYAGEAAASAFYVNDFARIWFAGVGLLGHTWSLAVEEQFYLLWPPILWLALRAGRQRLLTWFLVAAVVAVTALRIAGFDGPGGLFGLRPDALLVGCLLAFVRRSGWDASPGIDRLFRAAAVVGALVVAGIALAAPKSFETTDGVWLGLLALCIGFALAEVVRHPEAPAARVLATRPFVFVGTISYGLYLWHLPVHWFVERYVTLHADALRVLLDIACTFAVALASYHLVEQPALRLKQRRFSSPGTSAPSDRRTTPAA